MTFSVADIDMTKGNDASTLAPFFSLFLPNGEFNLLAVQQLGLVLSITGTKLPKQYVKFTSSLTFRQGRIFSRKS